MSKEQQGFAYFKEVAIGAVSGVAILALIIGGFSLSGGAPAPTQTQAQPSATVTATPTPTASNARTCSVKDLAADPLLG